MTNKLMFKKWYNNVDHNLWSGMELWKHKKIENLVYKAFLKGIKEGKLKEASKYQWWKT